MIQNAAAPISARTMTRITSLRSIGVLVLFVPWHATGTAPSTNEGRRVVPTAAPRR
jgi:hypothetical protein